MLCRSAESLPEGELWSYEPKLDGFRAVVLRDGRVTDIRSRNDKSLAGYFPEVLWAASKTLPEHCMLDGEIVAVARGGFSFELLQRRLVAKRDSTPVAFIAFDVLSLECGSTELLALESRRELMRRAVPSNDWITEMVSTDSPVSASAWLQSWQRGIEGVVAKRVRESYRGGSRRWIKIKRRQSMDVVVGGCRPGNRLLLGVFDKRGRFSHVGETVPLNHWQVQLIRQRIALADAEVWTGRRPGVGHWEGDKYDDWIDCKRMAVVEVSYAQLEGSRFRHPVRFLRLRPDRDASSCTDGQFGQGGR